MYEEWLLLTDCFVLLQYRNMRIGYDAYNLWFLDTVLSQLRCQLCET